MDKCPTLSGQCLAVSFICIPLVQFGQYTVSSWTKGIFSVQVASFALNKVNSTPNFLSAFFWEFWESGSDHQTSLATLPAEPSHPPHNCSLEGAFPFLAMFKFDCRINGGIQGFRYKTDIEIWTFLGVLLFFLTIILTALWRMGYSDPKISAKLNWWNLAGETLGWSGSREVCVVKRLNSCEWRCLLRLEMESQGRECSPGICTQPLDGCYC